MREDRSYNFLNWFNLNYITNVILHCSWTFMCLLHNFFVLNRYREGSGTALHARRNSPRSEVVGDAQQHTRNQRTQRTVTSPLLQRESKRSTPPSKFLLQSCWCYSTPVCSLLCLILFCAVFRVSLLLSRQLSKFHTKLYSFFCLDIEHYWKLNVTCCHSSYVLPPTPSKACAVCVCWGGGKILVSF
jgi:hypothetical protein